MRTTSHTRSMARSLTAALTRPLATSGVLLAAAAVLAAPAGAQGRWGRGGNGGYGNGGYGNGGYGNGGYGNGGYGRSAGGARSLYAWSGRVDREAYIVMQSGDVRARVDGGYDNGGSRVRVASDLPQADGVIDVRLAEGRGRVDVVEQPSQRNGYRAVVRVRDDAGGAGYYRFVATWRPTGGGGYADGGRDGRSGDGRYGDGRSGDGRYGDGRSGDGRDRDERDRDARDRDGRYGRGRDDGRRDGDGRYSDGRYSDGRDGGGAYGGSGVLHWRGRVDDVAEIRLQGGRVDARTVSGQGIGNVRSQFEGAALPARDVAVHVTDRAGRGRVSVVQQPHAWNGYTAVIRVEDHDAGADYYNFDVSW